MSIFIYNIDPAVSGAASVKLPDRPDTASQILTIKNEKHPVLEVWRKGSGSPVALRKGETAKFVVCKEKSRKVTTLSWRLDNIYRENAGE